MGGITRRSIEVGADTCLLGFSGRSYIKSAAFDVSTLAPVGGISEQQVITVTGSPSGGTLKLKYRGQETATIAYNDTAANVQIALRALSNIGSPNVTVAGGSGGPWTVTFAGTLANQDVYLIQLGTNAMTGGTTPSATITQSVMGVSNDPRILVGSAAKPGTIVTETSSTPKKVKEYTAAGGIAEAQTVTITGTPAGGSFKLNYKGSVTGPIAYNASSTVVAAAVNALDSVDEDGGVVGSGGALPGTAVILTFNNLGARPMMSADGALLTGGTAPAIAVTESTAGADAEAIWGVIDGVEEFISNTPTGDRDVAVYVGQCVFNTNKIKNYSTYSAAFNAWCVDNFNRVEAV
jgi:hypothetical protein